MATAPKSKAAKTEEELGEALEKALEIDFDESTLGMDMDLSPIDDDLLSLNDLEAQISQAAQELAAEKHNAPPEPEPVKAAEIKAPLAAAAAVPLPAPKPQIKAANPIPAAPPAPPKAPAIPAQTFKPANDDLLQTKSASRPSAPVQAPRSYSLVTAIISVLWAAGVLVLGNALYGSSLWSIRSLSDFAAAPYAIGLAAAIIVPIMLFWAFALMVRRAQEMQYAARSMAEAAMRLSEPEMLSSDRVASLGQAVRREVAAMSEGVERTLARAVELETLVQTEVNQLERVYTDNEYRIRTLVDRLGGERESVIGHAERVRASISSAHEQLKDELSQAGDALRENLSSASTNLTMSISQSGETLIDRLTQSGQAISESIVTRSDDISHKISTSGEAFANLLEMRIAALSEQTDAVTLKLADTLDGRTNSMLSLLGDANPDPCRRIRHTSCRPRYDDQRTRAFAACRVRDTRAVAGHKHRASQLGA
ncbi:apolipoprotein A1/A4/E family protein [Phyllobacterium sp. A18/5-2]|uniref:apolipoprotein A1/A4/E family protein n=1 Tax=Phyllobacterium sp. A18/5-2 TaxID=2978392 RepID=UPI0021C840D3|nr:apolipoprotein A1/A4/E family protein [Phyllobacterium sp. A18/5-2]UXN64349.1 apolipoprotein A1/A4/E family protein [Phyllobacterium sp. A18/5-2]